MEKPRFINHQGIELQNPKWPYVRTNEVSRDGSEVIPQEGAPAPEPITDRLWVFEVLMWVLCASGLIAIAAILRATQDQPVPAWTAQRQGTNVKLTVTINSVISIFSTLMKSTLLIPVVASLHQLKWIWFKDERPLSDIKLFEAAGKGPLGSAILVWTLRGKRLACLGAFITIASLGVDFTLQQLVTYPLRPAIVPGIASVARTNAYSGWRDGPTHGTRLAELPMLAAAYRGIYNSNSQDTFLVTPQCSSGNCTWDDVYTSLGVCGRCYDVTNLINKTCDTYPYLVTDSESNVTNIVGAPIPYCNYTLPNGQGIFGNRLGDAILVQVNKTAASSTSYFGDDLRAHLSSFTVIRADWTTETDTVGDQSRFWNNLVRANATECGWDVCTKKYQSSMKNTVFEERVLDTFINTTAHGVSDETGSVQGITVKPTSSWTNHPDDKDANIFEIDPFTTTALRLLFDGSSTGTQFWEGSFFDSLREQTLATSDITSWIRYLDDAGMKAMADSVAASMTKRMREAPDNENVGLGAQVNGLMYQDIPYVNVRWGWIAFPLALVFLALVFLILTMMENASHGTMLWKSNSLANFYHPLTKDGRNTLQSGRNAAEAEEIAEKMKVKWAKTSAGYRLVQGHEA